MFGYVAVGSAAGVVLLPVFKNHGMEDVNNDVRPAGNKLVFTDGAAGVLGVTSASG